MNLTAKSVQDSSKENTLLFVDDEQNILSSLRRLFRPYRYRILTALSARDGLIILENEHVDLVISDMRMPEMDGTKFLGQVANDWPDTMRILLTGYADLDSTIEAINSGKIYKYMNKPWEDSQIILTVQRALEQQHLERERKRLSDLVKKQNSELSMMNMELEKKVASRTAELEQAMGMLEKAYEDLREGYRDSIKVFSGIIEMREKTVAGHSNRVADNAQQLALALGMDASQVENVQFAALLHDIGKIILPDALIHRSYSTLNLQERSEVEKHPIVGESLLMSLNPLQYTGELIRNHHEYYNGSGYPDGKSGESIPLGARILTVANEFDGLLSGELLQRKYSKLEAMEYLSGQRGKLYDTRVVDAFLKILKYEKVSTSVAHEKVSVDKLVPGMRLSEGLTTRKGAFLLPSGHILDTKVIEKIKQISHVSESPLCIAVYTEADASSM